MKYFTTIFTLLVFSASLYAQIYIIPRLGLDFTKMESKSTDLQFNIFEITNKGFEISSLTYGIQVECSVFKYAHSCYSFDYTRKEVDASIFNFLPLDGFVYRYYRNSLSFKYSIKNIIYLGIGAGYNIISNGRYTIEDNVYDKFFSKFIDYGIHTSVGTKYKGWVLEGYYYNGLNPHQKKPSGLYLNPVKSIGLSLGYSLEISCRKINKNGA